MMSKILIIKSRNIGDVLLMGPLCSSIKLHYPQSEITVAVKIGTEAMLKNHPHVDSILTFPKKNKKESGFKFFLRQITWYWLIKKNKFDIAINTTEGDRGAITAFISRAKQRIGVRNRSNQERWNYSLFTDLRLIEKKMMHTVIRNLQLLPKGIKPYTRVEINAIDSASKECNSILKKHDYDHSLPIIQIHPVSRWFFKCWTDASMAKVIDYLIENWKCEVILTAGPDLKERNRVDQILDMCKQNPINLSGKLSLEQMIELSRKSKLFFGVDTAPMHIAAALDVPVIALFGPSGVYEWGPWPNNWQVEGVTPYPHLNGNQYMYPHTVLQLKRECIPCGQDGCNGSKRSDCLEALQPDEVIRVFEKILYREGFLRNETIT